MRRHKQKMMNSTISSNDDLSSFKLSGELNISTVHALWQASKVFFKSKNNEIVVDLADVSHSDSAGVALLVALVREARLNRKKIYFIHLPAQMLAIMRVSGLEQILPIR